MNKSLLLALIAALAACSRPAASGKIERGSRVKIDYTLTVDGAVYDSSQGRGPLAYRAGSGGIIPGLDEALLGLAPGDQKAVTVPPEKGYGLVDPSAVQTVPLSKFGAMATQLKVGVDVQGLRGGQAATGKVTKLDAQNATLDFNHPLAGKTLHFQVTVVSVDNSPAE